MCVCLRERLTIEMQHLFCRLTTEKVRVSPSELDAIVQAFMECLQYTVSQNLTDPLITDFILNDEVGTS